MANKNPTLLQYLEQCKKELQKKKQPIEENGKERKYSYIIKTYCVLPFGNSLDEREELRLRPTDVIHVTFKEVKNTLTPKNVVVIRSKPYDDRSRPLYWKAGQIKKWLKANALKQNRKIN